MARPDTVFEAISYDLKQFRERRMAERRAVPRGGADRRVHKDERDQRQPAPLIILPPVRE